MATPTPSTRTADSDREDDPDDEADRDPETERLPPHSVRLNTMGDGDPPANHVLEADEVMQARFMYVAGLDPEKPHAERVSIADLAEHLGCSTPTARNALAGETYQWVAGPVYDPDQMPRTPAAAPNQRFPSAPWLPPIEESRLRRAAGRGESAADVAERFDDDRVTPAVVERWAGRYGIDAFA